MNPSLSKVKMSKDTILINSKVLYCPIDDYRCVQILESGWLGYYHVIEENGDLLSTLHRVMSKDQILEKYEIKVDFNAPEAGNL